MTREDVKKLFPEATDEQVNGILNAHHSEMSGKAKTYESRISELKEKADAFDKAEADKLSEKEKLDKLLADAEKNKVETAKLLNRTKAQAEFVREGLKEEDYTPLLDGIVTDNEEATLNLAKSIINAVKSAAASSAAAAKQELMQTPQPGAGSGKIPAPDEKLKAEYDEAMKSGDMVRIIKATDALAASQASQKTGG